MQGACQACFYGYHLDTCFTYKEMIALHRKKRKKMIVQRKCSNSYLKRKRREDHNYLKRKKEIMWHFVPDEAKMCRRIGIRNKQCFIIMIFFYSIYLFSYLKNTKGSILCSFLSSALPRHPFFGFASFSSWFYFKTTSNSHMSYCIMKQNHVFGTSNGVTFSYSPREANGVAHHLAKHSYDTLSNFDWDGGTISLCLL